MIRATLSTLSPSVSQSAPKTKMIARLAGILLLAVALALYLGTLTDSLTPGELRGGDTITHMYAMVEGRFSNAPGYQLFIMGGWLWFHILRPLTGIWANPIQILSSYTTLWGILSLAALYGFLREMTDDDWPVALLLTAFYAVTYFFWFYSISLEEYTSAVLQQILLLWALMRWDSSGQRRYLFWVAFLGGLSLAHMITVAIIVPAVLWFILSRRPELLHQPKLLLALAAVALLPLLSYIYVYLVGAAHPEWRGAGQWPSTLAWFLDFLSTKQGQGELTWTLGPLDGNFPRLVWQELTWPILILGLPGLAFTGKRRAIFFYATLVIYFLFCYIDRHGNWFQAVMPLYPQILLGVAVLLHRARGQVRARLGIQVATSFYVGALIGLLALVAYRYVLTAPHVALRGRPQATALQAGQAILTDQPAANAGIVASLDESLSLQLITRIYGQRPDVQPLSTHQAALALAAETRPIYAVEDAIPLVWREISPNLHLSDQGRYLAELHWQPQTTLPTMQVSLNQEVIPGLHLLGYSLRERAPGQIDLSLFWQATQALSADAAISVRPLRGGDFVRVDGVLLQEDRPHPVDGQYPFTRWQPGEVVRDVYPLDVPGGPPADGVAIILYRPTTAGFENLANIRLKLP